MKASNSSNNVSLAVWRRDPLIHIQKPLNFPNKSANLAALSTQSDQQQGRLVISSAKADQQHATGLHLAALTIKTDQQQTDLTAFGVKTRQQITELRKEILQEVQRQI